MAKQIQVTLHANQNPPLTVNPTLLECSRADHTIEWTPGANSDSFSFSSLSGLPSPPFSTPTVTAGMITVTDNNSQNGTQGSWTYAVTVVSANGTYYTVGTAAAAHRGGTAPVANRIQGGNDPTIKNN